nr:YwqG family protein [uncultured Chitinophaga sp.]
MTIEQYKELIREFELSEVADYVLSAARPIVNFKRAVKENYQHPGNSRVGGDPDLPAGFVWPLTETGTPMTFIAQLDLDTIHPLEAAQLLPSTGVLYFFMGDLETARNIPHKVIYVADKTGLQRTPPPAVTILEEEGRFNGYGMEPVAALMPPNYAYADYEVLSDDEGDAMDDLCSELTDGVARIGGYPDGQHDDHNIEAAMYLVVGQPYDYSPKNARNALLKHFKGDQQAAEAAEKDMTLLLQVDSDQEVGFCWGDAGCLQFMMDKKALLARAFDHTYLSLYSS